MGDLDRILDVEVSIESAALSLPGFGTPLILAVSTEVPAAFTERVREYTDPSGMITDGFLTTDTAYIEARSVMSQRPRPSKFKIGRRLAAVAQVDDISVVSPSNNGVYGFTANGVHCEITADGTATAAEVATALVTAWNLLTDVRAIGITAAVLSSTHVTLTADQAGISFTTTIDTGDATVLVLTHTTASVGIPEDLTAILAVDQDWYALLITQRDRDTIMLVAATIEAMPRMFYAQSNDAAILSSVYNSATPRTDVASELKAGAYTRTSLFFHDTDADPAMSAWVGRCIGPVPASISWMYKKLAGITARIYTDTEYANLISKNANGYMPMAGTSMTFEGKVSSGEFIDIIRGVDKLTSKIQENIFSALIKTPKVPFTDNGLKTPEAGIRAAFLEAVRDGLIADSRTLDDGTVESPAFTITAPKLSDISASNRANRRIPAETPYTAEGTLAGAIHYVAVRATVSV